MKATGKNRILKMRQSESGGLEEMADKFNFSWYISNWSD